MTNVKQIVNFMPSKTVKRRNEVSHFQHKSFDFKNVKNAQSIPTSSPLTNGPFQNKTVSVLAPCETLVFMKRSSTGFHKVIVRNGIAFISTGTHIGTQQVFKGKYIDLV